MTCPRLVISTPKGVHWVSLLIPPLPQNTHYMCLLLRLHKVRRKKTQYIRLSPLSLTGSESRTFHTSFQLTSVKQHTKKNQPTTTYPLDRATDLLNRNSTGTQYLLIHPSIHIPLGLDTPTTSRQSTKAHHNTTQPNPIRPHPAHLPQGTSTQKTRKKAPAYILTTSIPDNPQPEPPFPR